MKDILSHTIPTAYARSAGGHLIIPSPRFDVFLVGREARVREVTRAVYIPSSRPSLLSLLPLSMRDYSFFLPGLRSPFTRPSSPILDLVSRLSPLPPDISSDPPSPLDQIDAKQLLISLQISAFAEHGVGSELEAL